METTQLTVGGHTVSVAQGGVTNPHSVLLLPGATDAPEVFDDVCSRLHTSDLRTVVPDVRDGLDADTVMGVLDALGVGWVHLVGVDEGAELAWQLAARQFGRFTSLVVADRGHPAVPSLNGIAPGTDCPAVELPTTVLVADERRAPEAEGSGRYVYADFRVVELGGVTSVPMHAPAEFATEIVLRSSPW
ncbi:alpha/beta hydrolase [Rhodococcus sp. HNM0569]|uniref:alpha/beta fold hydrolase n=1 Tax=Rhodococcus sp. HNM0569 TaxID=2716340 RepID=UPI00146E791C|nr:alpha/beta hydrolase [Rhodococcus sp. HNM0569]NLU81500.1 alpha/beta hydrolase [Rhodococcus sp. HNM0569]